MGRSACLTGDHCPSRPCRSQSNIFAIKADGSKKRSFVAHLFLVQDTELLLHQAAVSLLSEGVPAIVAKLA